MSGLIDPSNELGDIKGLTRDLSAAVTGKVDKPKVEPEEPAVPAKYKGKTKAQLIDMHQNAETQLGRVGNDLGQYRTLTDELLDLKRKEDLVQGGADPVEITSTDILDKPTESVRSVVEDVLNSRDRKTQQEDNLMDAETMAFNRVHPDAGVVANSPEFQEWVQASPVRQRTAQQAYQSDWMAADALLNEWKALSPSGSSEADTNEDKDLEAARNASTESVSGSDASASSGKIYRRIDLIKLKLEQPELYADEGYQSEIMRAYAEGRVR